MHTKFHMLLAIACFALPLTQANAQQDSTVKKTKEYKNTVRYNLTNPLLFGGKNVILGYERVLGPHQSISINVGTLELPKPNLIDINTSDSIQLQKNSTQKGYNTSLDYRFYLAKENKYNAPRGVYLAPYVNYSFFERTNTWTLNTADFTGDVSTKFQLTIATVGGELGYQFILWNRVAIDLILIGPGMSNYKVKGDLSTTLDADEKSALLTKINDALDEKIPGYKLVIDDAKFEKSGSTNTTTIGYRYLIHVGFRF